MPLSSAPEPKRRFIPSKWEMMRVMKIVKAIKEGRYIDSKEALKRKVAEDDALSNLLMIWNDLEDETLADSRKYAYHLPAPKVDRHYSRYYGYSKKYIIYYKYSYIYIYI